MGVADDVPSKRLREVDENFPHSIEARKVSSGENKGPSQRTYETAVQVLNAAGDIQIREQIVRVGVAGNFLSQCAEGGLALFGFKWNFTSDVVHASVARFGMPSVKDFAQNLRATRQGLASQTLLGYPIDHLCASLSCVYGDSRCRGRAAFLPIDFRSKELNR